MNLNLQITRGLIFNPASRRGVMFFAGLAIGLVAYSASADVRLPKLFASHMVVQHDVVLPVWGWADPREKVTVQIAGGTASTTADANGKWRVNLAPVKAGGPYAMGVQGKNRLELTDILAGEIWICCGQSNMEMPVGNGYRTKVYPGVVNFQQELAGANLPKIRLFLPDHQTSLNPKDDLPGPGWQACTPETAARFSAVGYFFARHLSQTLNLPVGMIQAAKSSTTAEAWISPAGLRALPKWAAILDQRRAKREKAEAAPTPPPNPTGSAAPPDDAPPPRTVEVPFGEPGCLFNGMIAPLIPFAIRGTIFYQGENNAKDPAGYRALFPALIRSWREAWNKEAPAGTVKRDFPFLFVQLAGYGGKPKSPQEDKGWMTMREAQAAALAEPATGMAVTIDIGAAAIHPPNKQEVGRRLGLLAEAIAYGRKVESCGPRFRAMKIEGNKVRLQFDHAEGGLTTCRLPSPALDKLRGFALAGRDKVYHWAEATVAGTEVVVGSPEVPEPVSVRYAWAGNPDCNLYNKAGLPAVPFRAGD